MLPNRGRIMVMHIPLDHVVEDYVARHCARPNAYKLPPSDAVMRHDDLPSDAKVVFASIRYDDDTRTQLLSEIKQMLDVAVQILPSAVPEGAEDDLTLSRLVSIRNDAYALLQRTTDALNVKPAHYAIVGIQSDTFDEVPAGSEPVYPYQATKFMVPRLKGDR